MTSKSVAATSGKALTSDAARRGMVVAAIVAFFGVAYLGPALGRLTTPRTRAQRLRDEAAFQAESFRRTARRQSTKVRKRARRLGGGSIGPR